MSKKIIIGKNVKFKPRYIKFCKIKAWEWNTVGGKMLHEDHADSYLKMRLISLGYPYKAKVIGFGSDKSTYYIKITFKKDLIDSCYIDRNDFTVI